MDSTTTENVCITSYNSTGFGLGQQAYIETLSLFSDIVCIQEHFLLDAGDKKYSNTDKIRKKFSNQFDMYIVPAQKSNLNLKQGRGSGGLATMWKKSLTKYVSRLQVDNYRIQATKFKFPSGQLLLLNTYFMCDPQTNNFDDGQLLALLGDINSVIQLSQCSNILWLGDINCDFSRNSRFVQIVSAFIEDLSLKVLWSNPNDSVQIIDFTHSATNRGMASYSTIDHFIASPHIYNSVLEASVIHSGDNTSNHSPIYCKINIGDIDTNTESVDSKSKPSWNKASDEDKKKYINVLDEKLASIEIPDCVECSDLHCLDHDDPMEVYSSEVLEAVDTAAQECIPLSGKSGGGRGSSCIPGWSEHVKPYQKESLFWHSVWKSAGKPNQGDLYNVMKNAKAQYKYAIRRLKKAGDSILNEKFVNSILKGGCNIFAEVRKLRGKSRTCSSTIDGEVGASNIANRFSNIYSDLYSKVEPNGDLDELCVGIEGDIGESSAIDLERVTEAVVKQALSKMKAGKSDGLYDFSSDCLLNGPPSLLAHLTSLIRLFLSHGRVPFYLLICTLVPIVKDNLGDSASSDNYRAIAIGSLLLKLLDWVILILEGDKLNVDQLQYGYQALSSTVMCTWSLSAVIDYYNNRGRVVYGAAMDCSKAFDMVRWKELFVALRKKGVGTIFLRLFLFIYKNQYCDVRWNGSYSHRFPVSNGVRQGAVSSPLFFSIYVDKLIKSLRESGIGCEIGGVYLGISVYADDIFLLSSSRAGLQSMVKICEQFAAAHNLKFSTNPDAVKSKTKCMIFSRRAKDLANVAPIMLNGTPLPWVPQMKHLGNTLQCDNSMDHDLNIKRAKFIGKMHSLGQEFHFCSPDVLMKIYNIYCCSFYGSSLYDLFSTSLERLYKSWNIAARFTFKVSNRTHRYLIEEITDSLHPKVMLSSRFVKFSRTCLNSQKQGVRLLASLTHSDQRTSFGRNLYNISLAVNTEIKDLSSKNVKKLMKYSKVPET